MAGVTTVGELTELNCGQQIADWSGLEQLTSLKKLMITGGYYNEPFVFPELLQLQELVIDGANIGTIDISGLTGLKALRLIDAGRLNVIDFSSAAELETLQINSGDIKSVNIASNTLLSAIDLKGSDISCNFLTELNYSRPMLGVEHDVVDCSLALPSGENHTDARRASIPPVIDGDPSDAVWNVAQWVQMDKHWMFNGMTNPTADDFSGQFKVLWDQDYLYLLFDITDDVIRDVNDNPTTSYWNDDSIEIFIDEDRSGGHHHNGNWQQAFAYHISTLGDNVDAVNGGPRVIDSMRNPEAGLMDEHITWRFESLGDNKYLWEMRMRVWGSDYSIQGPNTPVKLFAGKILGFTPSYIDLDTGSSREHFMSSVFTDGQFGHNKNQGYLDSSEFGTLMLLE